MPERREFFVRQEKPVTMRMNTNETMSVSMNP